MSPLTETFRLLVFHLLISNWPDLSDGKILRLQKRDAHGFTGVCVSGKKQSPIDIKLGSVISENYPSFHFDEMYQSPLEFLVKNNGHTVHASLLRSGIKPMVSGGGLPGSYIFEQFHFHWGSEHLFDGRRFPLEMHIVHFNSKYGSLKEALNYEDGVVVFGVIFNHRGLRHPEIENFFKYVREEVVAAENVRPVPPSNSLSDDDDVSPMALRLTLRNLLPPDVHKFIRYDGSLTTPECNEVVQWTVFTNHFYVSEEMVAALRTLKDAHNRFIISNFREPQNLNGRDIFIQTESREESQRRNAGYLSKKLSLSLIVFCILFQLKFTV